MAKAIKRDSSHKKWFDIPGGEGASVELCEKSSADSAVAFEALAAKVALGGNIFEDIEKAYIDAISDWKGIEDESGKVLKCTIANKRLLLQQTFPFEGESVSMVHFLRDSLRELREEAALEREAAEKN